MEEPQSTATTASNRPRISPGGFPRLWRLSQKELREILRDRRTIVTLVLMPILDSDDDDELDDDIDEDLPGDDEEDID